MLNRRDHLKSVAATLSAWLVPNRLFGTTTTPRFHFINADTLALWTVSDPVSWALQNQHEPFLERAAEGLKNLTVNDGERVLRLIMRRCRLNLLELFPGQVVVHHWAQARADLRPFFKTQGLARPEIEVLLRDRKKEVVMTKLGDSFRYGDPLGADFPLDFYRSKWASRFYQEADDSQAAPKTNSDFVWDGIEGGRIPWAALKSAWRRAASGVCLNCSGPTLLVNFGLLWRGMFNRTPRLDFICGKCRRVFRDETVDVRAWMEASLDAGLVPVDDLVWGRRLNIPRGASANIS